MKGFRWCAAVLVALLLAGCTTTVRGAGSAPPPAGQLLTDGIAGLGGARTGFALTVTATDGRRTFQATTRVQGDDGSGTLTVDGAKAELRNVGGDGYAKATAAFWTGYAQLDADTARDLDGRWVALGPKGENLLLYVSQPTLVTSLESYVDKGSFRLVGRGEIAGTPARRIEDADGGTASVSAASPARVLEIATRLGKFRFSYPPDELTVAAPDDPLPFPR